MTSRRCQPSLFGLATPTPRKPPYRVIWTSRTLHVEGRRYPTGEIRWIDILTGEIVDEPYVDD